jgi:ribonuclease D
VTAEVKVQQKKTEVFDFDLSKERAEHYMTKSVLAIDTETRGLQIRRDRLCLIQMCDEDGLVSFVQFPDGSRLPTREQTNLKKLLEAKNTLKLFHFARFDVSVMKYYLGVDINPLWCTKIASKLVRTYTDKHSLKDLVKELLGFEMDKTDQSSDWARSDLSDSQLEYAANDVRFLIPIYKKLQLMLEREGRMDLALRLFGALPTICELDLGGWSNVFEH